ncbi:MAG: rhlE2, partial [Ramlibacter sp.]|nr:rhlE2 [Ramlibacter sp.]
NDGRRAWREAGEDDERRTPAAVAPAPPPERRREPPRQGPRDPFFDQPYQSPQREAAPTWEASGKPSNRISANIKPKRKLAALFKAEAVPVPEEALVKSE